MKALTTKSILLPTLPSSNSILVFSSSSRPIAIRASNLHLQSEMNTERRKTAAVQNGGGRKRKGSTDPKSFYSESKGQHIQGVINRLSKWIVGGTFVGVLVWNREAESLWMAMGSVMNAMICATLKRVMNEERPDSTLKSDPGMPSSHAQSIFYIHTALLLSYMQKLGVNEVTMTATGLALACASYLSWLRVVEGYHTKRQVMVGAAVGLIVSIMWHWAWHSFVFQAFLSYWWVRTLVTFGAASFSFSFLLYVLRYWL